ncbi:MAG: hypothetical protein K5754_09370 [Butyrivibrio sp.]|jgi:hypothetical protein|nr:hypothetical protein [Butyrivibrio sp.]
MKKNLFIKLAEISFPKKLLCILGIVFAVNLIYKGYIDIYYSNAISEALNNKDFDTASELSDYYLDKNSDKWIEYQEIITKEIKTTLSPKELVENYPDDYIYVSIPYHVHYMSGVNEFGITIKNDSDFTIEVSGIW